MRPTIPMRNGFRRGALLACAAAALGLAAMPAAAGAAPTLKPPGAGLAELQAITKFAALPGPSLAAASTAAVNRADDAARQRANVAQVTSGTCLAQIVAKKGKSYALVTLKIATFKYKFVRKAGGGFRRVIIRATVSVKRPCATACVLTRRLRGTYRPVFDVKSVKT